MNNSYLERAKQQITDPQILSVVAAKRAKQLAAGGRPMIKCDSENLLDIALLEIAEGLFISSRAVSGAMRKLVTDGFVEKVGQDPVMYALTEKGRNIEIEE